MKTIHSNHLPLPSFSVMALGVALMGVAFSASVVAGIAPSLTQASHVTDTVMSQGGAPETWKYEYTVWNDGSPGFDMDEEIFVDPQIRDWELPWFGDEGISGIQSPTGWDYAIETEGVANGATGWDGVIQWKDPTDPWFDIFDGTPFVDVTQVLHWYTNDSAFYIPTTFEGEDNWLGGFSFIAEFDQTAAPYQASWAFLQTQTGDPALPAGGSPGSPSALGTVPEPATLALVGAGLLGFGFSRGRKKRARPG